MHSTQGNQPEPPLRLLSFDGGGVRGYAMLLLLQELMLKTFVELHGRAPKREEIPRPCDHFDLIAGTGTGGILAILLGRLRLDVDACLEIYSIMTKKIFATDKTIGGVPYGKTLYKASELEDAFRLTVQKYETPDVADPRALRRAFTSRSNSSHASFTNSNYGSQWDPHQSVQAPSHFSASSSESTSGASNHSVRHVATSNSGSSNGGWGALANPGQGGKCGPDVGDALLYDDREGKCKTFVTACYKGAKEGSALALLRTYDSARETAPCPNIKIWEAGRATSAIFPAFKELPCDQTVFLDEGPGVFSPVELIIDEALHEFPGRKIGLLVSIGSGKLPASVINASQNQSRFKRSMISATPLAKFAQARDVYMTKITDCENIHLRTQERMEHVNYAVPGCYVRLNVEVGVGEVGMSEFSRLAEISVNTRQFLARGDIQAQNIEAGKRLAHIHRMHKPLSVLATLSERGSDSGSPGTPTNKSSSALPNWVLNRALPTLPTHPRTPSPVSPLTPERGLKPAPPMREWRDNTNGNNNVPTPVSKTTAPLTRVSTGDSGVLSPQLQHIWRASAVSMEQQDAYDSEDEEVRRHLEELQIIAKKIEEEGKRANGVRMM
ncbi:FabD/lysophospholipase-like protein [Ascobolus immersus RN42]|uniref:FabD/lysophospholipase-like protein n=1 Tax=Ascobolus immersus RN42 TaxID=1160509 RepID=A0A3N4HP18_ASCIM|nr:FabD/lysophospholipase-like protein [Ascobolus immersus RN42]